MLKLRKKVFISAMAVGFLLGGTGLLNVSTANASTGQGNNQPMIGFQAGMGGQGQPNMWLQFGASMRQQYNQQQHNQQQHKQKQHNQQQYNQQQYNQQQKQPIGGQFVQGGQMFGFAGGNLISQVADILDVEEQTIIEALQDGQSLVEIAGDYDVSEDELLEQLEELQSDAIDDAVDAGTLTDSQAERLKDQLTERLEQIIESTDL